jgi:uncharacterized protein
MRIAVTGASGFIGSALVERLRGEGDDVVRLVQRSAQQPDEVAWDPDEGGLDPDDLTGVDVAVHLAGHPIGPRPWTSAERRRILDSRLRGTATLAAALAAMPEPPAVLVSASGMNYYGDRGDEVVTEDSGPGEGFLADVVRSWEAAADPAREAGIRVVHPRTSLVLDGRGGILPKLALPFRLGLGARFGAGTQWWSWVTLDDALAVLLHALREPSLVGAVNAASPNPVTQAEFAGALAATLNRPAFLRVPAFAPKLVLGEMADQLLFGSLRLHPAKLLDAGFTFRDPELEPALRRLLRRAAA